MLRLRIWVPEPHDLVHALQPEYSETTQSTAHAAELHVFTSLRCGQVYPPCIACLITERERIVMPVPHDLVQVVNAEKLETRQCVGQCSPLQTCVCDAGGHALPPCWAAVTWRLRVCEPPSQVLVHVVHASNSPYWQSTGQCPVLQGADSESAGQSSPPCAFGVTTLRECVL